jgi:hypothetical protein
VTTRLGAAAAAAAASKSYPSPPCPTFTVEVDTTEREGVNGVHLDIKFECFITIDCKVQEAMASEPESLL